MQDDLLIRRISIHENEYISRYQPMGLMVRDSRILFRIWKRIFVEKRIVLIAEDYEKDVVGSLKIEDLGNRVFSISEVSVVPDRRGMGHAKNIYEIVFGRLKRANAKNALVSVAPRNAASLESIKSVFDEISPMRFYYRGQRDGINKESIPKSIEIERFRGHESELRAFIAKILGNDMMKLLNYDHGSVSHRNILEVYPLLRRLWRKVIIYEINIDKKLSGIVLLDLPRNGKMRKGPILVFLLDANDEILSWITMKLPKRLAEEKVIINSTTIVPKMGLTPELQSNHNLLEHLLFVKTIES